MNYISNSPISIMSTKWLNAVFCQDKRPKIIGLYR